MLATMGRPYAANSTAPQRERAKYCFCVLTIPPLRSCLTPRTGLCRPCRKSMRQRDVGVSSTGQHDAIALAVNHLSHLYLWIPGGQSDILDDRYAFRRKLADSRPQIVRLEHQHRPLRRGLVRPGHEMKGGLRIGKSHFDPAPTAPSHGGIADQLTSELIDVESLGSILIEHWQFREGHEHQETLRLFPIARTRQSSMMKQDESSARRRG